MKNEGIFTYAVLLAVSFVLSVALESVLIPTLRRLRAAQPILEIGPSWRPLFKAIFSSEGINCQ